MRSLGARVRWIQCLDPSDGPGSFPEGQVVRGWRLPSSTLEMGWNRVWAFPHRLREIPEGRIYLGDPTLLPLADRGRSPRIVAAVHDLRPLTPYGDRMGTRWMFRAFLPRLHRVRRIRVYTQHMQRVLEDEWGLRGKVYILPPPATTSYEAGREHSRRAEERVAQAARLTVLYVATDRRYKNVPFFVRLAEEFRDSTDPSFHFVLVSRLRRRTAQEVERKHLTNLTVLPWVTDIESLYRDTDILAFPSLYEGFGHPLLEAMAHGLPVLANDFEPVREVVGTGGALLPTNDLGSWTERLRHLAQTAEYHQAAERALERAQFFSHERFARDAPGLFA